MSYYDKCAFPKPKSKPKKKKVNGFKNKPNRRCYYTKQPYAERHEIFGGSGKRQISIDNGFQLDLHPTIHKLFHGEVDKEGLKALEQFEIPGLSSDPLRWADKEIDYWQKHYQRAYEEKLIETGITPAQARDLWKQLMIRSYL